MSQMGDFTVLKPARVLVEVREVFFLKTSWDMMEKIWHHTFYNE